MCMKSLVSVCVCARARACVRARVRVCARACVRARVCARAWLCACICVVCVCVCCMCGVCACVYVTNKPHSQDSSHRLYHDINKHQQAGDYNNNYYANCSNVR